MPELKPILIKEILKVLRAELALQTRHGKLLEAQQRALLACDRPRFAALQEDYAEIVVQLEAQDTARKAVLQDGSGAALTLSAIKDRVPANDLPKLESLEENLRQALDTVQALARRNETLIQNELDYLAFSLDLFVEAGRNADTGYGARHGSPRTNATHSSLWLLDHRA